MPAEPRAVVVDSGPLIALFDAADHHHAAAIEFVRRTRAPLHSSMAAITEAMYVLDDLGAGRNLLTWIHDDGLILSEPEPINLPRIIELLEKYADLPMDFTDAVIVELCERTATNYIASVDRHFEIYRFRGRTKFSNVFLTSKS